MTRSAALFLTAVSVFAKNTNFAEVIEARNNDRGVPGGLVRYFGV
jgi:hypothetical protein